MWTAVAANVKPRFCTSESIFRSHLSRRKKFSGRFSHFSSLYAISFRDVCYHSIILKNYGLKLSDQNIRWLTNAAAASHSLSSSHFLPAIEEDVDLSEGALIQHERIREDDAVAAKRAIFCKWRHLSLPYGLSGLVAASLTQPVIRKKGFTSFASAKLSSTNIQVTVNTGVPKSMFVPPPARFVPKSPSRLEMRLHWAPNLHIHVQFVSILPKVQSGNFSLGEAVQQFKRVQPHVVIVGLGPLDSRRLTQRLPREKLLAIRETTPISECLKFPDGQYLPLIQTAWLDNKAVFALGREHFAEIMSLCSAVLFSPLELLALARFFLQRRPIQSKSLVGSEHIAHAASQIDLQELESLAPQIVGSFQKSNALYMVGSLHKLFLQIRNEATGTSIKKDPFGILNNTSSAPIEEPTEKHLSRRILLKLQSKSPEFIPPKKLNLGDHRIFHLLVLCDAGCQSYLNKFLMDSVDNWPVTSFNAMEHQLLERPSLSKFSLFIALYILLPASLLIYAVINIVRSVRNSVFVKGHQIHVGGDALLHALLEKEDENRFPSSPSLSDAVLPQNDSPENVLEEVSTLGGIFKWYRDRRRD
ncbi:hypothetical protein IE077_000878 [Cardiosporidium cionae]|uniref:Uncharacterized protein n=1 Tax=Cardiosporidium cionae TaxID=476202 RepID=A0ABQ7JDT0_9APIC|nr:hypothetical protein IE077_000878 [Cardiosporidium cionae]|eukprot:KAF8822167.1 hypothetical protein IE077_000878 [Cardiosporidium cionae]